MKYLLYYKDGFIKKFPLEKSMSTLGRGKDNDLVLDNNFLSRKHLKILSGKDHIVIKDLNSTNGTFIDHEQVSEAEVKLGDSFSCGGIEFFLRKGFIEEFKPAKELIPIFKKMKSDHEKDFREFETRNILDIYNETLKQVLRNGLKKKDFNEIITDLSASLSNLQDPGNYFLVSKQNGEFGIQLAVKSWSGSLNILKTMLDRNPSVFNHVIPADHLPDYQGHFGSFPIDAISGELTLIYISRLPLEKQDKKMGKFLLTLSKEISLLSQLFNRPNRVKKPILVADKDGQSAEKGPPLLVAGSRNMLELIKQTRKIAASDLFILIEGESGTGKELFARLIHRYSSRKDKKFVALNCAAIPENLLESELFGYEKGAFTGAYTNKTGKLELASGGTLVLDEIGNMSLPLQAKLLRALQEYEFYRLGSSISIKVDLRIISLTNSAIQELLREKKIREDLYYRLAHHIISIPPLRDRKEDIPSLINHFTEIFSRRIDKKINGYTMEAFKSLQQYDWPGNVRQLENEVKRLVNLADEDEVIKYDLLSEVIKNDKLLGREKEFLPLSGPQKGDREHILFLLKQNNWNKSRTARMMHMTYQGLHKKMKKMGISKKKGP
jgi:transcriptional regulator with PAS, ATPase and Fis domain